MGKYFGTDGVRGVAGADLTCELAMKIGRGAAAVLTGSTGHRPRILIGKDTRQSGDMLEAALTAGLCSVGADVESLGVVPTPAVAYLVRKYNADAGVVISASHNPMEFNGIKIFAGTGYKLPDEVENEIEAYIDNQCAGLKLATGGDVGRVTCRTDGIKDYTDHLYESINGDLSGLNICIDCANGASAAVARQLFPRLGAKCTFIGVEPDGKNINAGVGSTHLDNLEKAVVEGGFDCGIAFDGDADRCLACDEKGQEIDGDKVIALLAMNMKEKGCLDGNTAVVTVMSNLGFIKFMESQGIRTEKTAVGDRYVLENMRENGYAIGGEQSGHVILLHHTTTMLRAANAIMSVYPQLNASLLIAGVIVHDLAKIDEMDADTLGLVSDYSVDGKLIGHIVRGVVNIQLAAEKTKANPGKALLLQHMVLSHHGIPEYGSPLAPKFPEAEVLNTIDTLDARLYEMDEALSRAIPGGFSEKVWGLDNRQLYRIPEDEVK